MKLLYVTAFCFFLAFPVFSQEKEFLSDVLPALEKQHHIHFSFLEEDIKGKKVVAPDTKATLDEKLASLEAQSFLHFERVREGYISISRSQPQLVLPLDEVAIPSILTTGISRTADLAFLVQPRKMGMLPGLTETDILQAMQQIPGVNSIDESVSNLNIRGGTHDQNLFLWNGIRMFQTGHFFGMISAFDPDLDHRIRIYKNGSSAFYGESVSGVVDMQQESSKENKYGSGLGSNLVSAEFHTRQKINSRSSFSLSGRRSLTDFFQSPAYKSYYNRVFQHTIVTGENAAVDYNTDENFFFYDLTGQYQSTVGTRSDVSVSFIAIGNQLGLSETLSTDEGNFSKDGFLKQQSLGANLNWNTRWNNRNSTNVQLYFSGYRLKSDNTNVESGQYIAQLNSVADTGLRLEQQQQFGHFTLKEGYQFNETGVRNNDTVNTPSYGRKIKAVLRTHAFIAETAYRKNSWDARLGFRLNYIPEHARFIAEPRLAVAYTVNPNVTISISGERKSQTTSQVTEYQRDFMGVEKRRWVLANFADVPLQQSTQAEIGFTYKNGSWIVTADQFYKKVSGISTPSQAFQNQLEFIRINGDYEVFGSEWLVQRYFGDFRTWVSYTINNNNYTFPDHIPPHFASNFEVEHNVAFACIYERRAFGIALGGKWHTGRPVTQPQAGIENQILYENPNGRNLPDYVQFNLSSSYKWTLGKSRLTAGVSLMNLCDRDNIVNRYYRINRSDNTIEKVDIAGLRFTPDFSLKYQF